MQNCNFQSCRQKTALPLDPDSQIIPQTNPMPNPPLSPLLQAVPPGGEVAALAQNGESSTPELSLCGPNGLCLPQPYPTAKANAENERYARIIRNSFAGRESALTAMMTYLYQSICFSECADDLRETLAAIALCKMFHLRLLGELLVSLGSNSKYYFYSMPPNANSGTWWSSYPANITYAKILGDALKADIEAEKASIDEHKSTIDYVDDEGIRALLKRIVMDEEYHLKIFTELYKRFCS